MELKKGLLVIYPSQTKSSKVVLTGNQPVYARKQLMYPDQYDYILWMIWPLQIAFLHAFWKLAQ